MTTSNTTPPESAPPSPKKGGKGKLLKRIILAFVLLLVIALVAIYFAIDPLVKRGVVSNSKEATDLDTLLNTASVSLLQGTVQLAGLNMANATGYKEPNFVTMNKCEITLQGTSLLSDTIQIDSISIDGLEVTLEVMAGGPNIVKSNLADIIETIKKKTALAAGSPPGKSLKIGSIALSRTKVHIRVTGLPVNVKNMDIELPPLVMKDPTNPDGRMEKISDLVGDILVNVAQQIMESKDVDQLIKNPMAGVMASLQGKFAKELEKLGKLPDLKNLPGGLKDIPNIPGNLGKDLGKDLPKGVGDLLNSKPPTTQK